MFNSWINKNPAASLNDVIEALKRIGECALAEELSLTYLDEDKQHKETSHTGLYVSGMLA